MAAQKEKRFVLKFINAAEDVPRLIRVYGKACEGEVAMVLRPPESRGVLVHVLKTGEAHFWKSEKTGGDYPEVPSSSTDSMAAVGMVKEAQKNLGRPGPITLRGMWRGWMHCDCVAPRIELVRKLATYGILRIISDVEVGWTWDVERTEKWFSETGNTKGAADTLLEAIQQGLAAAMGLLGEACSMRDSRRRAAFDVDYAEKHPIRPAREARDPLERFNPREPKKPRKAASKRRRSKATPSHVPAEGAETRRQAEKRRQLATSSDITPDAMEIDDFDLEGDVGADDLTPALPPDPEKDKLLLDAFSKAVAQALGQGA